MRGQQMSYQYLNFGVCVICIGSLKDEPPIVEVYRMELK